MLACTPIEFLNNSYSWSELYTCAGDAQSISYSYLGKQQNNKTFPIYYNTSHTPYEFIKISNDKTLKQFVDILDVMMTSKNISKKQRFKEVFTTFKN